MIKEAVHEIKSDPISKYKVGLIGAKLDSGNMGVSALAASLVRLIKANCENVEITLLISNRSSEAQYLQVSSGKIEPLTVVNYRLSPRSRIHEHIFWIFLLACIQRIIPFLSIRRKIIDSNRFLKTMDEADFIGDIRGGDSFSDIYGPGVLVIGSMPALIALLLGKKLVLLPQTYGPYNSALGRYLARHILKRAHHVISRDRAGVAFLNGFMSKDRIKEIAFCPDVAFMLDPIKPKQTTIVPPLPDVRNVPLFGLNISGLMYIEEYLKNNSLGLKIDYRMFAQKMALTILERTDAHILFVPHTFSPPLASDPDACSAVMKTLPDSHRARVHIVSGEYDQSEIKAIIGACDFFVGSRMHACIAALSQGIPTVGVAYSKKFVGVFESVGMADVVVDGRYVVTDDAVEKVLDFFKKRDELKNSLDGKINIAKEQIMRTFEKIFAD